jgi:predicted transglutaminase-like cysteine proteinase
MAHLAARHVLLLVTLAAGKPLLAAETDGLAAGMGSPVALSAHDDEIRKVEAVNAEINQRFRSVSDLQTWGVEDYWATPAELDLAGGGDCEDLALAKYHRLILAGIAPNRLWLVIARAVNRQSKRIEPHMVLVFEAGGGRRMVLDNLHPALLPLTQRWDLIVSTGFNEQGLWRIARDRQPELVQGPEALPLRARRVLGGRGGTS